MEEWELHRRIALKFVIYLGEKPRVILGGIPLLAAHSSFTFLMFIMQDS